MTWKKSVLAFYAVDQNEGVVLEKEGRAEQIGSIQVCILSVALSVTFLQSDLKKRNPLNSQWKDNFSDP